MKRKMIGMAQWCAATAGVFVLASGGLRPSAVNERELECEQAVAHLQGCCPDFPVTAVDCDYSEGCNTVDYPLFSIATSQCLQNLSCAEIEAADACGQLEELLKRAPPDAEFPTEPTYDLELCNR